MSALSVNLRSGLGLCVAALVLALPSARAVENPHAGLWAGTVVIERVNRAGKTGGAWDPNELLSVASPFAFRLLLHVDTNGQARLLQRVLTVWDPKGSVVTNSTTGGTTTNGCYVLLSDESQVSPYLASHPDSKVYRVSSVNLPLMAPQPMAGGFGGSNSLVCTVALAYDDPVNPFVHGYAPLHDNLRVTNGEKIKRPAGEESYDVTRNLTLVFAEKDPDNPNNPRWDVAQAGGEYRETVEGLYQFIRVQGRFRLDRISTRGQLEQ